MRKQKQINNDLCMDVAILHDKIDNLYQTVHNYSHILLETVQELKALEKYLGVQSVRDKKVRIIERNK